MARPSNLRPTKNCLTTNSHIFIGFWIRTIMLRWTMSYFEGNSSLRKSKGTYRRGRNKSEGINLGISSRGCLLWLKDSLNRRLKKGLKSRFWSIRKANLQYLLPRKEVRPSRSSIIGGSSEALLFICTPSFVIVPCNSVLICLSAQAIKVFSDWWIGSISKLPWKVDEHSALLIYILLTVAFGLLLALAGCLSPCVSLKNSNFIG